MTTVPLAGEIVEGASGATGTGEVYVLFTPKTGTTFATFAINGSCALSGSETFISGRFLGYRYRRKLKL
jgi:hypothetical protein